MEFLGQIGMGLALGLAAVGSALGIGAAARAAAGAWAKEGRAGKPLDFKSDFQMKDNTGVVATNGAIHDDVIRALEDL